MEVPITDIESDKFATAFPYCNNKKCSRQGLLTVAYKVKEEGK
jgi:hypothetical protein